MCAAVAQLDRKAEAVRVAGARRRCSQLPSLQPSGGALVDTLQASMKPRTENYSISLIYCQ